MCCGAGPAISSGWQAEKVAHGDWREHEIRRSGSTEDGGGERVHQWRPLKPAESPLFAHRAIGTPPHPALGPEDPHGLQVNTSAPQANEPTGNQGRVVPPPLPTNNI